jgi:hypothetical protein
VHDDDSDLAGMQKRGKVETRAACVCSHPTYHTVAGGRILNWGLPLRDVMRRLPGRPFLDINACLLERVV